MEIGLRPLTEDEYPAFRARSHEDYVGEIQRNLGVSEAAAREKADADFERFLPDGLATVDHFLYAITADGERVGELWVGLNRKADGIEAFGYDFWVRPDLRDAGIGRRAMQLAAAEAKELGAIRLALNVFGENERALHLYRSFGFEVGSINMVMPIR